MKSRVICCLFFPFLPISIKQNIFFQNSRIQKDSFRAKFERSQESLLLIFNPSPISIRRGDFFSNVSQKKVIFRQNFEKSYK